MRGWRRGPGRTDTKATALIIVGLKGYVHHKMKVHSLSTHRHAGAALDEVSRSKEHFRSFTAKQFCSTEIDSGSSGDQSLQKALRSQIEGITYIPFKPQS